MGGSYSNTDESMAEILQAMQAYFPDTMKAVAGTYGDQAKAEYDITKEYTPKYAQLQYDTIKNEGGKLSEAGRELSRQEQLGASNTELEIARGPGREIAADQRLECGAKFQEVARVNRSEGPDRRRDRGHQPWYRPQCVRGRIADVDDRRRHDVRRRAARSPRRVPRHD